MKRTRELFLLAILILICGVSASAQDPELDVRATYETLAAKAGWNIVFPGRGFASQALTLPFNADNISTTEAATEALNKLAKQTTTFWTRWDDKTILVFDDTQSNRRDFDRQFVRSLDLGSKGQNEVIADLRMRGFRQVAVNPRGNAIFVRDTVEKLRLAESTIANASATPADRFGIETLLALDSSGTISLSEGIYKLSPTIRQRQGATRLNIKSITLGADDLLTSPMTLTGDSPGEIQITLGK